MYIMCLSKGLGAIKLWMQETHQTQPVFGFIPNAGDTYIDPYFVEESCLRLKKLGVSIKEIDLRTVNSAAEFEKVLEGCDGIGIAGGNTFNLLYQLRRSGSLDVLRRKVKDGLPYFGESAGACALYSDLRPLAPIDDPQDVPQLHDYEGINLIDFIVLPHVDREKYKDVFAEFYEKTSKNHKVVKIRDNQALITRDGKTYEIVDSEICEL